MAFPLASFIVPTNSPVSALNPLITPLLFRLFVTSSVLLSVPKLLGAAAKPQGWFSGDPCVSRFRNTPVSLKMSMYPPPPPDWLGNDTNTSPFPSRIPNRGNPAGIVGSVKELTRLKFASYISTLLFQLSAANRKFPDALLVIASPVYTAPEPELFTAMMAEFGFDCGAHPLIVPSSVANRKIEAHPCTWNSCDPLYTIPVGEPAPCPLAGGTVTLNPSFTPAPV